MKRFILYTFFATGLSCINLVQLLQCKGLVSTFYFNQPIYAFHLQLFFHTDKGLPHVLARAFHNKVTIFFPDVFNAYLHFWDLLFIISFLGIISTLGLFYLLWSSISKPSKLKLVLILTSLFVPLIISLLYSWLPHTLLIFLLWLSWQGSAVMGLYLLQKSKHKYRNLLLIIALFLTIFWIIVFNQQLLQYCIK